MTKKIIFRTVLKNIHKQHLVIGVGILLCVTSVITALLLAQQTTKQASSSTLAKTKEAKKETSTSNTAPKELKEAQPTAAQQETSTSKNESITKSSTSAKTQTPQSYQPTTSPQPAATAPFRVTSVLLDQPAVFCSGGDHYIAQIGDVDIYLSSPSGGSVSYGFEVTGGIEDQWHGYQQQGTVPAGAFSMSVNRLLWGNNSTPHMAFSQTIWAGHGQAAVRAVVYTPNVIYSQWITIPPQSAGEQCS